MMMYQGGQVTHVLVRGLTWGGVGDVVGEFVGVFVGEFVGELVGDLARVYFCLQPAEWVEADPPERRDEARERRLREHL